MDFGPKGTVDSGAGLLRDYEALGSARYWGLPAPVGVDIGGPGVPSHLLAGPSKYPKGGHNRHR